MIERRTWTKILAKSPVSVSEEVAALIERGHEVTEVHPPRQGLVMCQVRETARNSRFYLGEALMTECRVRIGEVEGLGAILGADGRRARAMAVVDAALSQPEPLAEAAEVERRIREAGELIRERQGRADARVLTSRVSFDTMGGQDMSVQAVVK